MPNEKQIQTLLRLKRYEQPPPGYFDEFLREFQRRQRSEMLRVPIWKLAWERLQTLVRGHGPGRLAYGGAVVAVLVVAGMVCVRLWPQPATAGTRQFASAPVMGARPDPFATARPAISTPARPVFHTASTRPHYVMDARPVSYELPTSF